jgi:hypothetical protein
MPPPQNEKRFSNPSCRKKAQRGEAANKSPWSAAICRRFPTTRHVASSESADMSAQSKYLRAFRAFLRLIFDESDF